MLHIVERADVVESPYVVAMGMGDEDGVEGLHRVAQHLLTEIGADVKEDILAVSLKQGRRAKPVVPLVGRAADLAVACYHRHPL